MATAAAPALPAAAAPSLPAAVAAADALHQNVEPCVAEQKSTRRASVAEMKMDETSTPS